MVFNYLTMKSKNSSVSEYNITGTLKNTGSSHQTCIELLLYLVGQPSCRGLGHAVEQSPVSPQFSCSLTHWVAKARWTLNEKLFFRKYVYVTTSDSLKLCYQK